MKNIVQDKNRLSQPTLDAKRTFYKKRLVFSKTHVLTQNGVRRKELCFQHKITKNTVQDIKRLSHPRLDAKRTFYKQWLVFSKTPVFNKKWCKTQKNSAFNRNSEQTSLGEKTPFST